MAQSAHYRKNASFRRDSPSQKARSSSTRLLHRFGFVQPPRAVQWISTSACDLSCPHCYSHAGHKTHGELSTAEDVRAHAERLLDDERARPMVRFFFDNLLPISGLSQLERDPALYPTYTGQIGALMREETQTFLEHEIFDGSGTWPGALTAPYTFVNQPLAEYYGIPGVEGDEFRKVDLDTSQRLGLLTQGGVVAGTRLSGSARRSLPGLDQLGDEQARADALAKGHRGDVVTIASAVAGGAVALAGTVLLAIGAKRRGRASSRSAFTPMPATRGAALTWTLAF